MRPFNPNIPLIFIHVPKTAGTSVSKIFSAWFGPGYIRHYFDEVAGVPPGRDPRFDQHTLADPVCIYGHFNRHRGFGVADNYPDAQQFVTILRDPFELALSNYFFTRKKLGVWKDQSRIPQGDIKTYLSEHKPNMLNHFPIEITRENYRDVIQGHFVDIGVTEALEKSLCHIASAIDREFDPLTLAREKVTARDTGDLDLGKLRAAYRDRNPLEFEVYDYVRWLVDRR